MKYGETLNTLADSRVSSANKLNKFKAKQRLSAQDKQRVLNEFLQALNRHPEAPGAERARNALLKAQHKLDKAVDDIGEDLHYEDPRDVAGDRYKPGHLEEVSNMDAIRKGNKPDPFRKENVREQLLTKFGRHTPAES